MLMCISTGPVGECKRRKRGKGRLDGRQGRVLHICHQGESFRAQLGRTTCLPLLAPDLRGAKHNQRGKARCRAWNRGCGAHGGRGGRGWGGRQSGGRGRGTHISISPGKHAVRPYLLRKEGPDDSLTRGSYLGHVHQPSLALLGCSYVLVGERGGLAPFANSELGAKAKEVPCSEEGGENGAVRVLEGDNK